MAKRKILIVEDEALIRMTTTDMVAELGYASVEAGDGQKALAHLDADAEIDVMLTDLRLPGMTGEALIAEARRRRPELKILVVSGYATASGVKGLEGTTVLGKPFEIGQLKRAIEGI